MEKASLAERLRYRFDVWMSGGTVALMGLLALATTVFVAVLGVITWIAVALLPDENAPDPAEGPFDFMWGALMRTLDPGTMGADRGWVFRILMLVVTVGGLIIVASLIGIVSGAFDSRIEKLRKGRSRVLERDHTLILGWNPKILSVISQLAIANQSRGRASIVVLADRDKVEMEDEIRAGCRNLGKTSVICRTGDPRSLHDLEIVSPQAARSIILLGAPDAPTPDTDVIKSALALTRSPAHAGRKYHIVGELSDSSNLEIARVVGGDEVHWVVGSDVIGRITVQACRQSGLSNVYEELLDFEGHEIYTTEEPSLAGMSFFDAQLSFDESTVIGLERGAEVLLNPAADTVLQPGDRLIVISEDDSTIRIGDRAAIGPSGAPARRTRGAVPERTLVLGVNANLDAMLRELDNYVATGSIVLVVADREHFEPPALTNSSVTWRMGDPTRRAVLESLDPTSFDHVIVLADSNASDPATADSRTLISLLHLRDIAQRAGAGLNIVSEMLDDANRELAQVTEADDFIVSDKLVALALAQISENRTLASVFAELFSSDHSEIYLHPAEDYVQHGVEVGVTTLMLSARHRGETMIGYRTASDTPEHQRPHGVHINPPKSHRLVFGPGDRVIVLAEG